MFDLVIKNGQVVFSDSVEELDIAVSNGKFVAFGTHGSLAKANDFVDASNCFVFPGAIDTHAHLNDPGFTWRETFEHGSAAAAVGGYTTVLDMPLQNTPPVTNAQVLRSKCIYIKKQTYVDFGLWGGLVDYNFGDLRGLHDEGVVSFKSFIAPVSKDYVSLNYGQIREALKIIASFDGIAGFHCEDFSMIKQGELNAKAFVKPTWKDYLDSRPVTAELIATGAVIALAKETGCRVHICHVSHPDVARIIQHAQCEGVDVSAETCTHYLCMTEENVLQGGAIFKCAPPLRSAKARDELWQYVINGTISGIASDHSPCTKSEKCEEELGVFGVWGGISGIQNAMQVVFNEGVIKRGLSPSFIAMTMSEKPAKRFDLWNRKGSIKLGFDADFVIFDPVRNWQIEAESLLYLNKISAFVGMKGQGCPIQTFVRGKKIAEEGNILSQMKGTGMYIKNSRACYSNAVRVEQNYS